VVSAILTGDLIKFVDIACEFERAGGMKFIPKPSRPTSVWKFLSPIRSMVYFDLAFLRH